MIDRFGCAPCKGGAFQWVQASTRQPLQPEATGAVMEVTNGDGNCASVSYVDFRLGRPAIHQREFHMAPPNAKQ